LNRQLFWTILIAGLFGSVSSYGLVSQWLLDYAYSIKIGPTTFFVTILVVYLIVFIIVGVQILGTSRISPVKVLNE